jgi:hypothetical protein
MKRFFVITVRLTDAVLEALSPAEAGFGYEWASILGRRASRSAPGYFISRFQRDYFNLRRALNPELASQVAPARKALVAQNACD